MVFMTVKLGKLSYRALGEYQTLGKYRTLRGLASQGAYNQNRFCQLKGGLIIRVNDRDFARIFFKQEIRIILLFMFL